ncbi:thiopeptide-type bacteriocin biosynthesis protein [Streptomyces sp. NPDC058953]|uniref:thiopeptide-type bacteriocin biosynthesis protein n=1 Tax=unclassified Streptomyces TaxID=2593676 RepID=UPI00367655D9
MHIPVQGVEQAIHTVLGGTPLRQAAADASLDPNTLEDAIDLYRSAGQAALDASTQPDWFQAYVQFRDWQTAEQSVIAHLWPVLQRAEADGTIAAWWFIRKFPCWRIRVRAGPSGIPGGVKTLTAQAFDTMVTANAADHWWESIYEPETYAFGGPTGIDIAHRLFHADSRELLASISRLPGQAEPPLGRKELSILLLSTLMRGAGQEWAEQGDIWHRVETSRPLPPNTPSERLHAMRPALLSLLTLDVGASSKLLETGGPLADQASWFEAFYSAGKQLEEAALANQLGRGTRHVVQRHILFHWNRMGLSAPQQSIVAQVARGTIFGE